MKLATLEQIKEIKPIDGADFIAAAKCQAYFSVVRKGEYNIGDWVIFIQPDSLVPRGEWNKFLWPKDDQFADGEPIRIRTKKLKRQISQGLIIPSSILNGIELKEGLDCTELLNIKHYEKPIPARLSGKIKGNFPSFLRKTDSERLKLNPGVFDELKNKNVVITTKIDGSSGTYYFNNGSFGVCSRNLDLLEEEDNSFWKIAAQYDIKNKLEKLGRNIAIQGEVYGEGIQGNNLGIKGIKFAVFDVFDIDNQRYFDYAAATEILGDLGGFDYCPLVHVGGFNFISIDELQEIANKLTYLTNHAPAEGLVIKPTEEAYSEILKGRISVKVISEPFALKNGE